MSDALRYRIIDEPRPGPFQRLALPPLLVFLVGNFFLPWGWLLMAANALALAGPNRNREILFSAIPIAIYFASIAALDWLVAGGLLGIYPATYLFAASIAAGLVFAAFAYISQARTYEVRRYLRQN